MCDDKRQVIQTEKAQKQLAPILKVLKLDAFFYFGAISLIPESGEFIQGGS